MATIVHAYCSNGFFPPMANASHITLSEDRPMHFACCVAMSPCLGMNLDLNKMPARDNILLTKAIAAYKQIRVVIDNGDLYRLEDPHREFQGALDFVSPDHSHAVVFVFHLKEGRNVPVFPRKLDPGRRCTIHELIPIPGRAAMPQNGQTLTGAELRRRAIVPSCTHAAGACVVDLESATVPDNK